MPLLRFLWAILEHWKGALMGGFGAAIVAAILHYTGKAETSDLGRAVLLFTFVSGCFFAWKEQYQEVLRLKAEKAHGLRLRITGPGDTGLPSLSVTLENPAQGLPVCLRDCSIRVQFPMGQPLVLRGAWNNRGGDDLIRRPMQPGSSRDIGIDASRPAGDTHSDADWASANYTVEATDSEGRPVATVLTLPGQQLPPAPAARAATRLGH
jgi:hypothetical protein